MAKSKNHTNHNQNRKDHRNGIKRPKKIRQMSMKGIDPKYVKNLKFSRRRNKIILKAQKEAKFIERAKQAEEAKLVKEAKLIQRAKLAEEAKLVKEAKQVKAKQVVTAK